MTGSPTPDLAELREATARTPQPQPAAVVLPTVGEVARLIEAAFYAYGENYKDFTPDLPSMASAQAVLDLIADRLPVWQPVEPGTVVKAGTRYRCETVDGESTEGAYSLDLTTREDGWFILARIDAARGAL